MEQNPINNALVTFDMAKNILKKHVTDENQIENLYKLVNRSETAFRLAVGLIQRCNIKLNDFIEKLEERYKLFKIDLTVKDNETSIIIAIFSLNGIFFLSTDSEFLIIRKKILLLLAYVSSEKIPLALMHEVLKIDNDIIVKALKPAVDDWRMSWNEKSQVYNLEPAAHAIYLKYGMESENELRPMLVNLLLFYDAKFSKAFNENDFTEIENYIKHAECTLELIKFSKFTLADKLLLYFIKLIEHIGCYRMQVNKNGELAAVYFGHALDYLMQYNSDIENSNEFSMRLSARRITALTIHGENYFFLYNNEAATNAIRLFNEALSLAEKHYKNKPIEIIKLKYKIALAYEILGKLDVQREIYESILDSIKNILPKTDPEYVIYLYNYASVLYKLKQIGEAAKLATHVKEFFINCNELKYEQLKVSILTEMEVILSSFLNSKNSETKGIISTGNFFSTSDTSQSSVSKSKPHSNKQQYRKEDIQILVSKHQGDETRPLVSKSPEQRLCCCLM